jgi:hypothetical protein
LNADLFRVHLANDPGCICGCAFEDAIHFILECCLYKETREELKLRLVFLHELKIDVLLFGDDTLIEMQNLQMFKSVQLYIKRTKRFYQFMITTPPPAFFLKSNKFRCSHFTYKHGKNNAYIKVITKLPNSEQSYKGKVKTHNYINRQNQSTTGKL